jgi:hypothetical protein
MLKDAAIAWVRGNCTDQRLRSDLSRKLKDALQRRYDCWFAVGQTLTKERAPYMIHCFAGELFIFQLSPAQAAGLLLAPNASCASRDPRESTREPRPRDLPVSITKLELDTPALRPGERIEGSIEYEVEGVAVTPYCLRLDCLSGLSGDEIAWNLPSQQLDHSGKIHFSFDPLWGSVPWPFAPLHQAPVTMFVQMFSWHEEVRNRHALSNTCGTLIDAAA